MEKTLPNTLRYDSRLCTGCGSCGTVCPHGVFSLDGSPVLLLAPGRCIECGACRMNCPTGAIAVDSGVGCAQALIMSALRGNGKVACGGGPDAPC
jgi:ferredoxin